MVYLDTLYTGMLILGFDLGFKAKFLGLGLERYGLGRNHKAIRAT